MRDVVIVGGGPAGLNAALILGRARRRVALCDSGRPRNGNSRGVNGFLSRDGTAPHELRRLGRQELASYESVELCDGEVADISPGKHGFVVSLADGSHIEGRKVLLATGLEVGFPDIEGMAELYGRGVFDCPYCDGWEERDRPLAVYGRGKAGRAFALELLLWSRDVILVTGGPSELSSAERQPLDGNGIRLVEAAIDRVEGGPGGLERICFANGGTLERRALFFIPEDRHISTLARGLGCELTESGVADASEYGKTNVPGVFVAGDASRRVQFAIVAAAEGAMAAYAINTELLHEDVL